MIEKQVPIPGDFVISTCQTAIAAYRKGESEDIRVEIVRGESIGDDEKRRERLEDAYIVRYFRERLD